MRKIELQELQKIELDMVKYLDCICRENQIKYFIVTGTLLGAVRHQGFIPWDDDIDVAMPRKDFEKFLNIMEQDKGYYKVEYYTNTSKYGYPFPKMIDTRTTLIDKKMGNGEERIGVYIDIFLYDGVGTNLTFAKIYYLFLKVLKRMVFLSRRNFRMESIGKTIFFAIPWLICRVLGVERINKIFNKLAARKDFYKYPYVASVSGSYGLKEILKRNLLEKTIDIKFEDTILSAPVRYDKYLRSIYGDYMKLPPEQDRISNHTNVAWWKEK